MHFLSEENMYRKDERIYFALNISKFGEAF